MADLTYQVSVETQQAQANLQRLQGSIKSVNDTFTQFGRVLGGLAIGAFTANAVKMAAAMNDVASASGIALQSVVGFSQAVAANGGTVEGASAAIGRFSRFINEAAEGNKNAQSTFIELGISLEELRTLSEQDLLARLVTGLANVSDNARRSALQMEIFGKAFSTVDIRTVNQQLDQFVAGAARTTAAMEAADKAEENFGRAMMTLQTSLLVALKPLSELAIRLLENQKAIERFFEVAGNAAKWALIVASIIPVVRVITTIGTAITAAMVFIRNFGVSIGQLFNVLRNDTLRKNLIENLALLPGVGSKAASVLNAMLVPLKWIKDNIVKIAAGIGALGGALAELFGAKPDGVKAAEDAIAAETRALQEGTHWTQKAREAKEAEDRARRQVTSAIDTETAALQKQVGAYQQGIAAALKKYQADTDAINLSERQRLLIEELQAAETAYLQAVAPLLEEYAKKKDSQNQVDLAVLPQIQQALQQLTGAYEEQVGAIRRNTEARAQANEEKAIEQYTIQQMQRDYDALMKVERELVRGPMSEIEKKYYDIMDAADASAEAAIRAEEARRGGPLSTSEIARYYEVARNGANRLWDANKRLIEQQRSFDYGWRSAFKSYVDNATNAAKQAERMFEKFTSGLEDLIVNFAKTGKFEWKSFVNSMLEELLRSQIKQTIASIMTLPNPFGGGTISDMFGGIFGALGGNEIGSSPGNPMYVVDISGGGAGGGMFPGGGIGGGQQGGGIFDFIGNIFGGLKNTASNIFGGLGNTVSNVVKTVGSIGGGLWDGIKNIGSSIVSGIGSLFGGFFANGGTLPAGKFGIVGERGPELVSGPASITPMGGFGMTNVTYNINAVDAASFKQLIASDPSFIHAVAMQGGRGMPLTGR